MDKKRAVVLVDLENIWMALSSRGQRLDSFALMDTIIGSGYTVVLGQSYCDYEQSRFGEGFQRDQTTAGFRQVQCPRVNIGGGARKSTVDPEIINDVNWALLNLDFDSLVLVAGDRDFIRAGQSVKNTGKEFALVSVGDSVSADLKRAADRIIAFEAIEEEILAEIETPEPQERELRDEPGLDLEALRAHFTAGGTHDELDLVAVGLSEPTDPIPLTEIGRVFTLEQDDIDLFLDGCDPEVREFIMAVYPKVSEIIWSENRLGHPSTLRHIANMLSGNVYGETAQINGFCVSREELFNLTKLSASYGVLEASSMFAGTTSRKINREHPFVMWLSRNAKVY